MNGPSLIQVPAWVSGALSRYDLDFADRKGQQIAHPLAGPWRIHAGAALHLRGTPFLQEAPSVPEGVDRERLAVPRAPGGPSVHEGATPPPHRFSGGRRRRGEADPATRLPRSRPLWRAAGVGRVLTRLARVVHSALRAARA